MQKEHHLLRGTGSLDAFPLPRGRQLRDRRRARQEKDRHEDAYDAESRLQPQHRRDAVSVAEGLVDERADDGPQLAARGRQPVEGSAHFCRVGTGSEHEGRRAGARVERKRQRAEDDKLEGCRRSVRQRERG